MASVLKVKNPIQKKFFRALAVVTVLFVSIVTALSYSGAKKELESLAQRNLKVLSESIYQSMTNTMLTGSPDFVAEAEKHATQLEGVKYLKIHKSQQVIQDFSPDTPMTQKPDILAIFKNHKERIREITDQAHQMQILKPFVAEKRCLNCHVSAREGDVLGVMDLRVSLDKNDQNIAYFTKMISMTNIFLATLLMGAVLFLLNRLVTKPLQKMIAIIHSLSGGNRDLTKRVRVKSRDELGKIADEFNNYLQAIEENQKQERLFITKAQQTIERVKKGNFDETITAETESETLNEFKDSVNDMLHVMQHNFTQINDILTQYADHNYKHTIKLQDIDKDSAIDTLIRHINRLRSVITEMLIENKKTNLKLNDFSDILLGNVNQMNNTAVQTQAALSEVNQSLQQITDNIYNNNHNVTQMSDLADNVSVSAKDGENLADKTTSAMNTINTQVNAINEAIQVIDQIAFQTNILSLNAAVEAATAGEAGKGFAVVASEVRNLASKSSEAAGKIKELVENASEMADEGKEIASRMIEGYHLLNHNILETLDHINEIKVASNDQLQAIKEINERVTKVTHFTQENSDITKQTRDIALKTDEMAKFAVTQVDRKEFEGKEQITAEA